MFDLTSLHYQNQNKIYTKFFIYLLSAHQVFLFSILELVILTLCIERPFTINHLSCFWFWRLKVSGWVFWVLLFLTDTPKGFSVEGLLHRRAKRNQLAPVIDAVEKWKLIVIPVFGPCPSVSEGGDTSTIRS